MIIMSELKDNQKVENEKKEEKNTKELPKDIQVKDAHWHAKQAARAGGMAVYKKYGKEWKIDCVTSTERIDD